MPSVSALARKNMVDCQIQTNGVSDPMILQAFSQIPRELFLPATKQAVAYSDEDILLDDKKFMLNPMVQGRLMQAATLSPEDIVLSIGDTTGYAAAVLSRLVSTVIVLEGKTPPSARTRDVWQSLGCDNIVTLPGGNTSGCPEHAPYTVIVLNGAVSSIPSQVLSQLAPEGRLVCVLQPANGTVGVITVIACDERACYSHKSQFDATAPWVDGYAPGKEFTF